jgi:hypothetical protein
MPRCLALALALLAPLVACGPDKASLEGSETSGETGDEFDDGRTLVQALEPPYRPRRLDLILIVDDSPSMRPFTETWAQNARAFGEALEAAHPVVDIRVAITTTSVPGPACPEPEASGGEPVLTSCRAHLEDFVGLDEHGELGGGIEDLTTVCETACSLDELPLVPSPGADEHDLDDLELRPWIEGPRNPFGGNLDGVGLPQALACAGLRGFTGCRFESPIEAAARMVEHMSDPGHPLSEFRRPDATLGIITIGDEDDCSHPDSSATIFDPAGERTFWPDPGATEAPSAVCINAGLDCDDQGCALTDHALDGSPTGDPASAVLTATTRLHEALEAAGELDVDPWAPVIANIGGYRVDGSVVYTPPGPGLSAEDQLYLDGFGVLPGCQAAGPEPDSLLRAGPGGRLAAAGDPNDQFSICAPDWTPALGLSVGWGGPQPAPWCIEFACVEDLEPASALFVPDCVVEQIDYDDTRTALPACLRDEAGWVIDPETYNYALPASEDACWAWRTDTDGSLSEDPYDDAAAYCLDLGHAGEIVVARRLGTYLPYDSTYELRCRPCEA